MRTRYVSSPASPIPSALASLAGSVRRATLVTFLVLVTACESGITSVEIASVTVDPATATLFALGDTVRLSAAALDADGSPITDASFSWSSSVVDVATVDSGGLVTAVSNGVSMITAEVDGVSATVQVTVSQAIASVMVSPSEEIFSSLGDTARVVASAQDGNGVPIEGVSFAWSSSVPDVASVDPDGLVTAVGDGETTIHATGDGISGSASIAVDQVATTLSIAPESLILDALEDTASISVTATDAGGSMVVYLNVTWSSTSPDVATVDSEGLIEAAANGSTTVTASADGLAASAEVVVQQQVSSIDISPTSLEMIVTDTTAVAVDPQDANGFTVVDATVDFVSADPQVATVDPGHRVAALSRGATSITASSGDATTTLDVSVSGTIVGGEIPVDTVWRTAGSPFVLASHVVVPSSVELNVDPGVDVLFRSGTSILVDGTFAAIGTSMLGISFLPYDKLSPGPGDWGVIRFTASSVDAVTDGLEYLSGSGIAFAEIGYGESVQFDRSSPYFHFNHVHDMAGGSPRGWPLGAIWACDSASPIRFSVIEKNRASGIVTLGGPTDIEDNQISQNEADWGGGIFVGGSDCGGGSGTVGAPVIDLNVISLNRAGTGGGIHIGSAAPTVRSNRIWDNVATDTVTVFGGGSGISLQGGAPEISDNELDGNGGVTGVPSAAIVVQPGFTGVIQSNNLVNQTTYEIFLAPGTADGPIDAQSNWWGTTESSLIEALIWDFSDDLDLAVVDYEPFATSHVPVFGCRCN